MLDENLLSYHFQPIVRAEDGEIYSYEALMRSGSGRKISPLKIIRYANSLGRIQDIEKATFLNVLELVDSKHDFFEDRKIFINSIPGIKLKREDQMRVDHLLREHAQQIVVELTEQAELEDETLENLKTHLMELGSGIAVDDYGTGYSNISNLLRYMPNVVKIDKSLLTEIQSSSQKQHFVRNIIEFCHDNNILALAEGVETREELQAVNLQVLSRASGRARGSGLSRGENGPRDHQQPDQGSEDHNPDRREGFHLPRYHHRGKSERGLQYSYRDPGRIFRSRDHGECHPVEPEAASMYPDCRKCESDASSGG